MGDPAALDDLVALIEKDGGPRYDLQVSTAPDERGIRTAVLSALPITAHEDVVDLPAELAGARADDAGGTLTRMGRGALSVTVDIAGTGLSGLTVVCCHLKSKLLSYPGGRFAPRDEDERARAAVYAITRRAIEAATVREYATRFLGGHGQLRPLVVLGDLNDAPEAQSTQILLGPGGSELGTAGALRPDRGDAARLWNLAPLLPADERYSRVYRGTGELIDQLFVSRALLERVTAVRSYVHGVDQPDQPPVLPSVTDDPAVRADATASDHAPVVATLA